MPTCNRCKAPIVWITTPKGKHMPCDPPIVTAPTVVTAEGNVVKDRVTLGHVPHWASCTQVGQNLRFAKRSPKQAPKETTDDPQGSLL